MAGSGGRTESYYARGMLAIRPTLHLAYRLTIRSVQLLEPTGAASENAGLWHTVFPAFLVLDVVIWYVLRRSDRFGLAWRLPLDVLDVGFWVMSPLPATGATDLATFIAVPLAVEAGVRIGVRALVVPAAVMAVTTVVTTATAKPLQILGIAWVAVGATVGMAFFRYFQHLDERAEVERRRHVAAASRRAYLAGQNSVAMGASSAVDVIEGLVPVLGRPPAGSALWRLADGWKSQLSTSTANEARYLQVALLEWERFHNAHPDLSGLVRLRVEEGQGTTLLSVAQVRQLAAALDQLALRGTVAVCLEDEAHARLPGQELRLRVGDHRIVLPADLRATPSPVDPAAVSYGYVGLQAAAWVFPPAGTVAPAAAATGVAVCAIAGFLSHRRAVALGRRARLGIFATSVAVSVVLTWLCAHPRAPLRPDGVPAFSYGSSIILLSFLGGYYWSSLGRWRWLVPASMGANVVLGLAWFPVPAAALGRTVLSSIINVTFAFFPCVHLSRAMDRAAAEHARSVEAVDEDAERAAFLEGRESVIGLVRQAREEATAQLIAVGPRLEGGLAELAAHRLEEVDRRLHAIHP